MINIADFILWLFILVLAGLMIHDLLSIPQEPVMLLADNFTFSGKKRRESKEKDAWYILEGSIASKHDMYPSLIHIKFRISTASEHYVITWSAEFSEYVLVDQDNVKYSGTEIVYDA